MGNVSVKRNGDEGEISGSKNEEEEEEEYMEYAQSPRAYQSSLIFTPQVPVAPLQRPDEMIENQTNALKEQTIKYGDMPFKNGIPTMITWSQGGNEVAVEGSWDDWKTREYLQRTDRDFTIMKMLPSGIYHFRFIVDGQWRYAPDFPHEHDDMGRVFNVLDLKDFVPEVLNSTCWPESPTSPASTYNSAPLSSWNFSEKLPDLPPLLQQTPLNRPSSSMETLEKPLPAVLNHLYFQKGHTGQSMVALSSTDRFRSKYVSLVLFKSLNDIKR